MKMSADYYCTLLLQDDRDDRVLSRRLLSGPVFRKFALYSIVFILHVEVITVLAETLKYSSLLCYGRCNGLLTAKSLIYLHQ